MSTGGVAIPDGNEAIRDDIPAVVALIERTARWVSPETFGRLPIWCPETARGQQLYKSNWEETATNTKKSTKVRSDKLEGNTNAQKALCAALGLGARRPSNWTVCHIWGYDDLKFGARSVVVQDPKYFSCVGNMVWLPTPLKGFTDAVPEVKTMLRVCAFHLYGWACEHPSVASQADAIRGGLLPTDYPKSWPHLDRPSLMPLGTSPFDERIEREISKRKSKWKAALSDPGLPKYPRTQVHEALAFWKVTL